MITFTISFLLSFSIAKKKPKSKEKGSNKVKEKKGKDKITEKKPIETQSVEEPSTIEFNATNILSAVHIHYELIPNRCKYELDVVCWGPVAKILTNDNQILVYTVIRDDTIWIPIRMEHYVESLSIKEIKTFHNQIIEIHITNNIQKAPGLFKTENIVIQKDEIINEDQKFKCRDKFEYVIGDSDPANASRLSLEHYIRNIIIKCANFPKGETVSWLNDNNNFDIFYDVLKNFYAGKYIKINELIYPCSQIQIEDEEEPKSKSKNKKKQKPDKKSLKEKKKKTQDETKTRDKIIISIPAEIFFTEFSMGTFRVVSKNNFVDSAFVFVSANNLLSRAQKISLNPIVVKIFKIENLPADQLRKLGFESIFASYRISDILKCTTKEKPLSENIYFNEGHMHFMDYIPKIRLIESIQTNRFFVEIYGNKKIKKDNSNCDLFGHNFEDYNISRIGPAFEPFIEPVETNLPVLLAVSVFDISSIVANIWDFREIGQCHAPNLTLYTDSDYYTFRYTDTKNVNDINIIKDLVNTNEISEATFLEFGTTVSIEVYLMAPQAPSLVYHHVPETYKRLFFITDNKVFAEILFNQIFNHNSVFFSNKSEHDEVEMNKLDILTGFVLDNGNSYFFYVEGPSTGFILNLWHMIQESCPILNSRLALEQFSITGIRLTKGRVFFNTDNAFEKRLYPHFIFTGLYVIVLKIPLQQILAIPNVYCRKKTPRPCLNALSKLSLLFDSNHYQRILQQNLLPSRHELISMNLEWGVSTRWKEIVDY
ncbi:uncharacterized protein LOC130895721 [Diorhabda carinulata]|uniref:uncharacterized protein LOC130895721 n=1 Tax=Diorhabda carinulata TaxID=1163345 RepID=UPI0025A2B392|nr:uncharacterized protein LOC130895721 [Diorhabda carinulata]